MGNAPKISNQPPIQIASPPQAPSLLYRGEPAYADLTNDELFTDLNLNPIIASLSEGFEWADLPELFRQRPTRRADVEFRLEILRDLQTPALREAFEKFSQSLERGRQYLESTNIAAPKRVRQKWRLDACTAYCGAVDELLRRADASEAEPTGTRPQPGDPPGEQPRHKDPNSAPRDPKNPAGEAPTRAHAPGLRRFLEWLRAYANAPAYRELRAACAACEGAFAAIRYQIAIDMSRSLVTLSPDASCADFCADLAALFPQFDLSATRQEIVAFSDIHTCALEERLLELLEKANPAAFDGLDAFCRAHDDRRFPEASFAQPRRELALYLACLRFADHMAAHGHTMCLPRLSQDLEIHIEGGYDVSLALKSQGAREARVVPNAFHAAATERCFVLTGPNQAGKTTFARALGQAAYLASLGLPVAADHVEIGFFNGLYTHFAVEEDLSSDSGRLREELTRLKPLMERAKGALVILNELFASTTTLDARQMAAHALRTLRRQDCTCLYVTHLYELADEDIAGAAPVSLVAGTGAGDPPAYVIARRPPQGLGLSGRLLAAHQLDRRRIKERYYAAFPSSS